MPLCKKVGKEAYYAKQQNLSCSDAHGRRLFSSGNGIWQHGLFRYAPVAAIGAVRITEQSRCIQKCGNRWIPPDFLSGRQRGAGDYRSHLYGSGWTSDQAYDGDTEGDYIFTPTLELPEGMNVAQGITTPQITITVNEPVPPML
ncbi:hypothetical protein SAMN02194393_03062 [Maledivibacter halophilus]|uniref:Uncharacterized protein n=1 Tax=Maledivibacter halophilus TaxID=36842 RepID=A0A1T5LM15_9FIRM|nr:hypothetical protein SAMN02194393_03062 [Maledivibacter halophilus]